MISVIIYAFGCCVTSLYAFKFYRAYKKTGSLYFKYSSFGCLLLSLGFFSFLIFPLLYPENSFLMQISYIMGELFIFLGVASIAKTISYLMRESAVLIRIAPFLIVIAAIIATIVHIVYFGSPWIDKYGLLHWNQHRIAKVSMFVQNMFIQVPVGTVFFLKRPKEMKLKLKSVFIALTLICSGTGGATIVIFNSLLMLSFGYTLFGIGFIFGMAALTIRKETAT